MKKKPDLLLSEDKVKEFIEEIKYLLVNNDEEIDDQNEELLEMIDFFSQEFDPNMVTEYFMWWNLSEEFSGLGKDPYPDSIIPDEIMVKNILLSTHLSGNWEMKQKYFTTKTLSQFITNCIQSGFSFYWK